MSELCVVCHAHDGPVCPADQEHLDQQLADLLPRYALVAAALLPGQSEAGERVAVSSHVHAGLPARVGALSLVGPGGDVPVQLHPMVRHWSINRRVRVTCLRDGQWGTVLVTMTEWFQEAVVGADGNPRMEPSDQVGIVPPREWLDQQVRRWRSHFGHHVPPRTLRPRRDLRTHLPGAYATLLSTPGGDRVLGFLAAVHTVGGAHARAAHFGMLGYEDPGGRSSDPVLDDIERRCGPLGAPQAMQWDVDYLRTWLDKACAEDALDIAGFAAQLRTLHAEIGVVLGDTPDQEWVGRCPAFLAEVDADGEETGRKRPCGAGLWQEKGAYMSAQVQCPRCRSTWDVRGYAGACTAREIRRVWPIDRRRRYTLEQIDRLQVPKCPGCTQRVKISWRDVTGSRDRTRTWQPTSVSCARGCDDARRLM